MSQVSSFPTIPASAMTSAGVHSAQTTHAVPLPQFAARPTALNGTKNPVVLPPPAYRPMLVPRPSTATLPPGVQHDMIPIPGAVPSLTAFPMIHTQSAISPPLRPPTSVHQPQTLPPAPLLQDNNALDLSAPTRKRKSEGSCSGDESLSPAPSSAKLLRDVTGSPVEITPIPKSPSDRDFYPDSNATTTASVYKPDINGNLMVSGSVGGSTETADLVESSTEPDISSWDVDGVVKFINSIPGCQEYSEVSEASYSFCVFLFFSRVGNACHPISFSHYMKKQNQRQSSKSFQFVNTCVFCAFFRFSENIGLTEPHCLICRKNTCWTLSKWNSVLLSDCASQLLDCDYPSLNRHFIIKKQPEKTTT